MKINLPFTRNDMRQDALCKTRFDIQLKAMLPTAKEGDWIAQSLATYC